MSLVRHLVIFTRYPRLGTGKRRLAAGVGNAVALRFQRVALFHLLLRLGCDARWRTWLAVTPDRSGPWPRWVHVVPQGDGDLGDRMARVAGGLPPGPVVIVGTDSPCIEAGHIARAFRSLGSHDAVFGPATDGGYWSVGLRRRPRFLDPFAGVRWSSEHALRDTLENLPNRRVAMLETLDDVDDAESLARSPFWSLLHGPRLS